MPRTNRERRRAWTALLVVALAVRIAAVVVLAAPTARPTAYEHGVIAENLLAGRGFSVWYLGTEGLTSQQAPWVPLVLAACYALLGVGTSTALYAYQALQCAAGVALVAAAMRLAWNLFPARPGIGWAVGWMAALYPPHVYMVTHVQAAPWAALGVTLLLALACNAQAGVTWRRVVGVGLLGGWLLLVDPITALVLPIAALRLLITAWRQNSSLLPAFGKAAVVGLTALVVVAPWLVRNYRVHGEFVFVKSSFGYALWQGNNELSWGTDKIPKPSAAAIAAEHDGSPADQNRALWEARHETLYIDDVLLKPEGYREFAGLSEPERSRVLGRRAGEWIASHPAAYARLCVQRLRYFLLWDATNPKALHPVYQASSVVWLVLSLIGLTAARGSWQVLWPTILAFAGVLLFHTLTITSARFRIPVEPLGLLWTAVGFQPTASHLLRRITWAWRAARDDSAPATTAEGSQPHPLRGPHRAAGRTTQRDAALRDAAQTHRRRR